jgi:leader peptidase (prepilin peptidase)/N-methyltransferase
MGLAVTLVVTALAAGWQLQGARGSLIAAGLASLAMISWVDLRRYIIPNWLLIPAVVLILGLRTLFAPASLPGAVAGGLLGLSIFWFIARLADGDLGGGDVRLAGFIGLLTGVMWVIPALLVGMLLGGVIAFGLTVTGRMQLDDGFPYGPALSLGAAVMLFAAVFN